MSTVVLRVGGVSKRFGGLQALSDMGITITVGQIYGLVPEVAVVGMSKVMLFVALVRRAPSGNVHV